MKKQRGLSLLGLLITSALVVFFVLIGFKLLPTYIEYFTVQRIISDLAHSPELRGGPVKDITSAFERRASIDNVRSISGADLEVTKVGDGFEIIANWTTRVRLFGNISACIDFEAKS